ncbi:Ras-related protein Rab-8A [Elysia marginata]|uniref:Ras-related protein Rab-8A n=1 Tax=Elysia marginata TaxID=1093978 RepID=A0AAV4HKZ4_9GAST|nr:Ras-related protein Rab-8A [Elysia marginata]
MPVNHIYHSMQNQLLGRSSCSPKPGPLDANGKQYFTSTEVVHNKGGDSSWLTSAKRHRHFSYGSATCASGYDYVLKIILLGDQGVGKTSYLRALRIHPELTKIKCKCRLSQLCDHLEIEVMTSNGKMALVKLCDTGGQERYRSLTSSYYRGAHGAILVMNLASAKSLESIEQWLADLDTFCSVSSCSRVLLGTNCTSSSRSVPPESGRLFAENRALPYMEIDAAQYFNVVESLQLIVDRIVREVTISTTKSQVIKPTSRSEEELHRREAKKYVCLC